MDRKDILLQNREIHLPDEDAKCEEEDEQSRPRRERRLPLKYRDDDELGGSRGNRTEDEMEADETETTHVEEGEEELD